jgi:hypothetical protein
MEKLIKNLNHLIKFWLLKKDSQYRQYADDLRQEIFIKLLDEGVELESDIMNDAMKIINKNPKLCLRMSKDNILKNYGESVGGVIYIIRRSLQQFFDDERFESERRYLDKRMKTGGLMEDYYWDPITEDIKKGEKDNDDN